MKLLISSLLALFLMACGNDSPTSANHLKVRVRSGSMIDSRDGQTYKTVTIGSQTWLAQNMNYETKNSYCYDDNPTNCSKYGRLYTWAAAMDSAGLWNSHGKGCGNEKMCLPIYPVRGVCPEGWHLPSKDEWNTLFKAVGDTSIAGANLKSRMGWKDDGYGTDPFSFSALPAGMLYVKGFVEKALFAYFWSSMEIDDGRAYNVVLYFDFDNAYLSVNFKNYGFSVRCLKD